MKYYKYILAINSFFFLTINLSAQNHYNILQRGKYNVGYESYWLQDFSRSFVHKGDTLYRPILVNIWYPSEISNYEMKYQDYLDFPKNDDQMLGLNKEYKTYNLNYIYQEVFHCEEDSIPNSYEIDMFFNRTIKVYKDALQIKKKFPLIIYHQGYGATIEDNSTLCEYLASNGYVVVGSSFFRNNNSNLGIDGRQDSVRDIHYLINHISSFQNIDITNIALVGHSGGAQASLMYKSSTLNPIKALVLLETTQEVYGLEDPRWNSFVTPVRDGIDNINGSLLGFAEHKAVFKLYDLMYNAERHYITLPKSVSHNDYIAQGIYGRICNDLNNKDNDSNTKITLKNNLKHYHNINNYILKFLDDKLKSNKDFNPKIRHSERFDFDEAFYEYMPKGDSLYKPKKGFSEVPSTRLIWYLTFNNKISSIESILVKNKDSKEINPIYDKTFIAALLAELLSQKKFLEAKQIFSIYGKLGVSPESSFIALSKISMLTNKKAYAKALLEMFLILNPESEEVKEILAKMP